MGEKLMKILSAKQMRALDRYCIDDLKIPGVMLMERAGQAVANVATSMYDGMSSMTLVLCGKGNNGGDGLVAARILQERGWLVLVVLPFPPGDLSSDALIMLSRAITVNVPIRMSTTDEELAEADVVIDALLGTGIYGPVDGVLAELIDQVNFVRGGRKVLAVDIPSGIDADSGAVHNTAIRAECTVTLATPKLGLLNYPGSEYVGSWHVAAIGFPIELIAEWPYEAELTESAEARSWLPVRPEAAHKRSVGWMLVVAGSPGMTGAAALACRSGYRSGAGLVRLALPEQLVPALNAQLTEVVFRPMPATASGTLSFTAVAQLLAEASEVDAALIGPGLSRNRATAIAVRQLVSKWPGPLVVDADALSAVAEDHTCLSCRTAPTIITPHPGEMARLLGITVTEAQADRIATAKAAAIKFNAIVVYKGTPALVVTPDGTVRVNPHGSPALATAGSGDVLAGSITALLAQGTPPAAAASLALYIGSMAANMLTARVGQHGITASDIIEELPAAMGELERGG